MKTWIDFAFGPQIEKIGDKLNLDSKLFYSLQEFLRISEQGVKESRIRVISIPLSSVRNLIMEDDLVFVSMTGSIPRFCKRVDLLNSNVTLPGYIKT